MPPKTDWGDPPPLPRDGESTSPVARRAASISADYLRAAGWEFVEVIYANSTTDRAEAIGVRAYKTVALKEQHDRR